MATEPSSAKRLSWPPWRRLGLTIGCSLGVTAACLAGAATHKQAILTGDFHEAIIVNIELSGLLESRPGSRQATMAIAGPGVRGDPQILSETSGTVIMGVTSAPPER